MKPEGNVSSSSGLGHGGSRPASSVCLDSALEEEVWIDAGHKVCVRLFIFISLMTGS